MKYILSGEDIHVQNILRENRVRQERGWVTFTPLADETETFADEKGVKEDSKAVASKDKKVVKKNTK